MAQLFLNQSEYEYVKPPTRCGKHWQRSETAALAVETETEGFDGSISGDLNDKLSARWISNAA